MQSCTKVLTEQATHVLILGRGPPTLQETNVTTAGRYHNRHVRRLGGISDRDGWNRGERYENDCPI